MTKTFHFDINKSAMPIDYKKYPPNWASEIVPRIRARAGNCCEWCGVKNKTVKSNGTTVVLTTAHLDHDSDNHEVTDDRLAYLCQACHLGYDRWRHIMKMKYGMSVFHQPTLF